MMGMCGPKTIFDSKIASESDFIHYDLCGHFHLVTKNIIQLDVCVCVAANKTHN